MDIVLLYIQLFVTFFEIGLFGFGGGYGMLSLIQTKVVPIWMTTSQFTNIVAISQMTPGPVGINTATYCGYMAVHNDPAGYGESWAILGSCIATFALVLPSLILMIIIAKMFIKYMKTATVQSVFLGLRPAVVGLLAAATLLLCTKENFSTPSENAWQFWISVGLFIATFIGTLVFKVNPIKMIVMSAFAGLLLLY
jgi:chromate transporter